MRRNPVGQTRKYVVSIPYNSVDDARVAYPIFSGNGGSIPTSALQFNIEEIDKKRGVFLNRIWHSRLPIVRSWFSCKVFGAMFEGKIYAVAFWSSPSARRLNGRNIKELRRLAIAPDAPKNTASRMLRVMRILIKNLYPDTLKLISYQDTEAHTGCIYKAAGWNPVVSNPGDGKGWGKGWMSRPENSEPQSNADKIRWEVDA